ncbi:hypothetical protein [Lichenicola sp.]|uniref:hypothetical protein n=1 Tax=Lichenicola sp. TaxID=2804529 RepID=UPI003B0062D2
MISSTTLPAFSTTGPAVAQATGRVLATVTSSSGPSSANTSPAPVVGPSRRGSRLDISA